MKRLVAIVSFCAAAVAMSGVAAATTAPVPGPVIPDTESPDVAVAVTSAGDPAGAVLLRAPFTVGASGETTSAIWDRGTETYRLDGQSSSSEWNIDFKRTGTDEVLAVRPDGGATVRWTQREASNVTSFSNPDHDRGESFDPSPLNGTSMLVEYGPGRASTAVYQDAAAPLTPEQVELATGDSWRMSIPMPAEPVGPGATWTWTEQAGIVALDFDVLNTARLDAVDGDRYTISVTYSVDLPAAPNLQLDEGVTSISDGTYSGTGAVTGSLSNPLDYHEKFETTYSTSYTLDDGMTYEANGASTLEYAETPLTPGTPAPTPPISTTAAAPEPVELAPSTLQLTDETGALTVAVPATWTDVRLNPNAAGSATILASTDLSIFSPDGTIPNEYSAPGVLLFATEPAPASIGTESAASFPQFDGCAEAGTTPYVDGTFTGSLRRLDCTPSGSRVVVLFANRDDGSAGVTLVAVLTQPGDGELDAILAGLDGDPTS